jgi:hypothetical protein
VKRLQIMIEEDLDVAVQRRADEEGVSKAAVIRRLVREGLLPAPALADDPLSGFVGAGDFASDDIDDIDDVVYR